MNTIGVFSAFCLLCAPWAAKAQTNLLVNGDFSEGPSGNSFVTVSRGQHLISGWSVARHSVDYITTYWQQPDGLTASIDLSGSGTGNQNGKLTQTFATTPGISYTGTFYFSANPHCAPTTKKMHLEVGSLKAEFTWNVSKRENTVTNMKWELRSFTFTAEAASSKLIFASQTTSQCGPAIAGVSVTPND